WKRVWFWILVSVFIQAIAGALLYRRRKQKELERQKTETARAQLAALEQQAFVSLMNPHFMFNSLNSIQHYINHQDRKNANRYLSDFASLIRKNFEAAQQAFIPLEQEIENLKVYLGLEQMRFNDKFRFEITCTDDTEPEEWMMPTMILQPLVENAILHGIMPSAIPGLIQLNFHADDKGLHIRITDNGIGIENSRKLKQGSKHRSRGMELIHKRLHALSFFGHHKLELIYKIPFTDPENPGSETQLFIPESLYTNWLRVQKQIQVRGDANK
ncbi:MAG TPA: histidine kinase, partial [Chitinophagaceae bacterium]|nr:histidine kinase [Chitinophagaceae bacterium]